MVRAGKYLKRISLLGAAETHEPCDLTWNDEAHLAQLAQELANQRLAVSLPRVPIDSPSIDALRRASAKRGIVIVRNATGTPYIDIDSTWADPQLKFNAGRRSDFRRAERHAEKLGGLTFEVHESLADEELDRLLDEAYAVEACSWKGEGGSALTMHRKLGLFFRNFAHAANRAGILRLALMRVGTIAVGMQIAVEWRQSFWLLKIGYDAEFNRCSPGNLLMLHTIGYAARRGLSSYEFLGSPAPWTAHWTSTLRPYANVRMYPFSILGQLALLKDSVTFAKEQLKKWWLAKQAGIRDNAVA
jgi:hypothetical protein